LLALGLVDLCFTAIINRPQGGMWKSRLGVNLYWFCSHTLMDTSLWFMYPKAP